MKSRILDEHSTASCFKSEKNSKFSAYSQSKGAKNVLFKRKAIPIEGDSCYGKNFTSDSTSLKFFLLISLKKIDCGGGDRKEPRREREKLFSPLPRGRRQIRSSAFVSRHLFGYYLPIASYGTIFAAKWSSNGGLEAAVSK